MELQNSRTWIGRILIVLVMFLNVQCALVFFVTPEVYAPGFELSGAAGAGMVRGMGILFLMWNVPYLVATIDPNRHRISLYEAIAMQTIGLTGEALLLATFPPGHPLIRETVWRFILFDGGGLLFLLLSAGITSDRYGR